MAIEHITTFVEDAKALVLGAYKGKPRFEALLSSYIKECQKLEDAIWSVILGRMIENAVGVQLDVIGKLVGEQRKGREDDDYRIWITVRIRINRSHGRPKDLLEILRLVEQTGGNYREQYPATAYYEFADPTVVDPNVLGDLMEESTAGGFMMRVVVPPPGRTVDETISFTYPGLTNDPARAFGHADDPSVGGYASVSYE